MSPNNVIEPIFENVTFVDSWHSISDISRVEDFWLIPQWNWDNLYNFFLPPKVCGNGWKPAGTAFQLTLPENRTEPTLDIDGNDGSELTVGGGGKGAQAIAKVKEAEAVKRADGIARSFYQGTVGRAQTFVRDPLGMEKVFDFRNINMMP